MRDKIKNKKISAGRFQDETERILSNSYLANKLSKGRIDMENGNGIKIPIESLWSIKF